MKQIKIRNKQFRLFIHCCSRTIRTKINDLYSARDGAITCVTGLAPFASFACKLLPNFYYL